MTEFSDAQIIGAIGSAVRAGDMGAVAGLVRLLALQNPREAQLLVDGIELLSRIGTDEEDE